MWTLLGLLAIIAAGTIVVGAVKEVFKDGTWRFLWRWFSGHSLNGHHYTDATWFRKGRTVRHPTRRVARWHHLPRIHRAGIRQAFTVALVLVVYGLVTDARTTVLALEASTALLAAGLAFLAYSAARRSYRHRATITPMASALTTTLRLADADAERAVTLRPNYHKMTTGQIGEIVLPDHFNTGNDVAKAEVENLVASRLPVDADFEWKTRSRPMRLLIIAAPKPPTMVRFEKYATEMETCKPNQVLVGLDKHSKPFTASFNLDDPHWGFSVGSGMGKTTFLLCTIAQILHNDADATVDGISPKPSPNDLDSVLNGIRGVRIAANPLDGAEMWDLAESVYDEMIQRQTASKRDKTVEFPPKLFVIDEVNTFAEIMRDHWQDLRREMKNPPAAAPIWRKIARILWMGRETNIHVIVVGQKLDDKSVGGIGLRDSLGFRGLAGFKPGMWKILIGTTPIPRSQKAKGRWIYSDGQTETWVQNLYADAQTIRDYASDRKTVARVRSDLRAIPADIPVQDYGNSVTVAGNDIQPVIKQHTPDDDGSELSENFLANPYVFTLEDQ